MSHTSFKEEGQARELAFKVLPTCRAEPDKGKGLEIPSALALVRRGRNTLRRSVPLGGWDFEETRRQAGVESAGATSRVRLIGKKQTKKKKVNNNYISISSDGNFQRKVRREAKHFTSPEFVKRAASASSENTTASGPRSDLPSLKKPKRAPLREDVGCGGWTWEDQRRRGGVGGGGGGGVMSLARGIGHLTALTKSW